MTLRVRSFLHAVLDIYQHARADTYRYLVDADPHAADVYQHLVDAHSIRIPHISCIITVSLIDYLYMEPITLYNSLTKKKELFTPMHPGMVSMYHCGPTVYNFVHVGNLRAFIVADVLRRVFEFNGYTVRQVMNITDIGHLQSDADNGEDKMTLALKREGLPLTQEAMRHVADRYYQAFRTDIERVHILPAHMYPFASDHIAEDITAITQLLDTHYAYPLADGIYFDTTALPSYGRLGGLSSESTEVESRIHASETDTTQPAKKNFRDFALWKYNDELGYEAPFGKGFPGWHIECSVMSMKYLGPRFDIHTGGIDHIAVHHNNELAQSEALSHELLAPYWLHNEHVIIEGGKKMAKSGDRFITLDHLTTHQITPLGYRYWLLGASYRTPIQFSIEAVRQAEVGYRSLVQKIAHIMQSVSQADSSAPTSAPAPLSDRAQAHISRFRAIINDDLHTAQAIAYLHESVLGDDLTASEFVQVIDTCDHALGLDLIHEATTYLNKITVDVSDIPAIVTEYATQREVARAEKNWNEADRLRDAIAAEGFNIKDTPTGYVLEKTLL